jgi:hypothetical protein
MGIYVAGREVPHAGYTSSTRPASKAPPEVERVDYFGHL